MKQSGTRQRWRPALILTTVALTGVAVRVAYHGVRDAPAPAAAPATAAVATSDVGSARLATRPAAAQPAGAPASGSHDLDPEVVALRDELDQRDAPESSACAAARDSERAAADLTFARDVETICVAWRKLMWDYAEAHAAEVEAGDPDAIERARNTFVALDVGLMQELVRAGGSELPGAVAPAAPGAAAPPSSSSSFAPHLGNDTLETKETL